MAYGDARGWDGDADARDSYPLAATLIGLAVIGAVMTFMPRSIPGETIIHAFGYLGGIGVMLALAAWGVAMLVTIRHASLGWKLASLGILLLGGMAAAALVIVTMLAGMAEERRAVSDLDATDRPTLQRVLRIGPPYARIQARFLLDVRQQEYALSWRLNALGFQRLNSAYRLQQDPSILRDCDGLMRANAIFDAAVAERRQRIATLRDEIRAVPRPAFLNRSMLATIDADIRAHDRLDRNVVLQKRMVAGMRDQCRILARRNWQVMGDMFMFTSQRELDEMNALQARMAPVKAELDAMEAARRSRPLPAR